MTATESPELEGAAEDRYRLVDDHGHDASGSRRARMISVTPGNVEIVLANAGLSAICARPPEPGD